MKRYEPRTETTTRQVLVGRTCDLCGRQSKTQDWEAGRWDINETEVAVTITQKEGVSFPDSTYGTQYEIDLCPDCFKDRLVPWLRSQGAKVEEIEWG